MFWSYLRNSMDTSIVETVQPNREAEDEAGVEAGGRAINHIGT